MVLPESRNASGTLNVAGTGGEGTKFWMSVLTDLRSRVKDVFFVVCDGSNE